MLVKICGITKEEEIRDVNELKPDYIGFVFAESKRKVDINKAKELYKELNKTIRTVGVFRNNDEEFILNVLKEIPLDVVQLHGDEDSNFILSLKSKVTCDIWKAINVTNLEDIKQAYNYPVNNIVLDGANPGEGKIFDWNLLKGLSINKRLILAGGINEENVEEGIKNIKPDIVDTSSGVEVIENGVRRKSKDKMKKIISKVREF